MGVRSVLPKSCCALMHRTLLVHWSLPTPCSCPPSCLQGGRRHQVQVVLKRTEYSVGFRAPWHTLQQPVCFTVQPDGGSCLLEQQLPLDGGRRLVEAGGWVGAIMCC